MRIQYNGESKILKRLAELVNQKADKSDIPAVGNGTLSVQRNGKSVGTFSANAAKDTTINIPVPEKVSELENDAGYTKNTGTYIKPSTGIPKSDLASGVQASLGKADTALQKHQDISGKLDKTGDASNTTVAFSAASARENVKTGEKLSVIAGKIAKWFADLKTVAFTGSYSDLANKPTIPDGSKYLPKAGGVMSGNIDMATNRKDILVGTQKANTSSGTLIACGTINTDKTFQQMLPTMRSYIGTYHYKTSSTDAWYDLISVRHRNGYNDGSSWGMFIYANLFGGDLRWNLNTNKNVWQGTRTLLDSSNYTSYALAKDGTAKEATTITETAWTAVPTTGAAATVGRSIKYLKSGNTVFVQGAISFNASLNTPVCGTMPSDCLPNRKLVFTGWDIIGAPEAFAIILDTDGKLSFLSPGTTAYWFKDHKAYSFNFSYHIN